MAEGKRPGRKKKPKEVPVWDENDTLKALVEKKVLSKQYLKEFCSVTLVATPDGRQVIFEVDESQKEAYCQKYYGKKLTVTDQIKWTTEQILEEYCKQECIENGIFKVSKNPDYFRVRPQYHWTDDKIWMHVFICLAEMTIGEVLHMRLRANNIDYSKNKMMYELNNIKDGWIYKGDKKVERKMEHLEPQCHLVSG